MSAFKVYGVSLKKFEDKNFKEMSAKDGESQQEYNERVRKKSIDDFNSCTRVAALTKAFDAPQFCEEFIEMCDQDKFKMLSIRAYLRTGGVVRTGKRKGLAEFKWKPYNDNNVAIHNSASHLAS